MLRWTNTSPGIKPTIVLAATRLSEQPTQRYSGDCCSASLEKKSGSCRVIRSDQRRLFSMRCSRVFTEFRLNLYYSDYIKMKTAGSKQSRKGIVRSSSK